MDLKLLKSPILSIGLILIFLLVLLSKGQLILNEEFLLIVNFFLLLGFFYQYVAEMLHGYLTSRQTAIHNEAKRVLSMHRHNASRLKETYRSKRFTTQIVLSSSLQLHRMYQMYRQRNLPYFLPFYVNSSIAIALDTVYQEEVQLLRSLYLTKAILIKDRLVKTVLAQSEVNSSLDRVLTVLNSSK